MHTVSLFPNLLDYSFLATGVLRITVGIIFLSFWYYGFTHAREIRTQFFEKLKLRPAKVFFWITSAIEGVAGLFFVIGYCTQAVALVMGSLMLLTSFIKHHKPTVLPKNTTEFYVLLSVVCFTLVFLGAGAFAVDLPV